MRERRPGYTVTIVPEIIGLVVKAVAEMQKTILMDSATLLRKVFPDLSKVTQKRIDLFPDSEPVMFSWPLKSYNAFALFFYSGNLIMPLII